MRRQMLTIAVVAVFALSAFVILPIWHNAEAGDSGNGCKLQGTWIGEVPYIPGYTLKYLATYHGTGADEGTSDLEYLNPAPLLALGQSMSSARGVWTKSGPNTFKFTLLTFMSDANGQIVAVNRNSGTKTLTDCNTMEITGSIEYLDPKTMEPIPGMCFPSTATARRVTVTEPCQ